MQNIRNLTEKQLIGCLLYGGEPEKFFNAVLYEDFKVYEHREIYKAARKLWLEHGCMVDTLLVNEISESDKGLVLTYVDCLEKRTFGDGNAVFQLLIEQLRRMDKENDIAELAQNLVFVSSVTTADLQRMENLMREINKPQNTKGINDHLKECFETIMRGVQTEPPMLITGLPAIDREIVNQGKGKIFVVAARPKMGKSSFLIQCAINSARHHDRRVCVVAAEMTGRDTVYKIMSHMSGVPINILQTGSLREHQLKLVMNAASELTANQNLEVIEKIGATADEICAAVQMRHEQTPFSLVLVDQLQSMKFSDRWKVNDIGKGIDALINLGKRNGFPVVLACQLGRSAERSSEKPQLSDLRDSGEIEQKADVVLFFHKERKWENTRRLCYIAASRFGPTGGTYCYFDGGKSKFIEEGKDDDFENSGDDF